MNIMKLIIKSLSPPLIDDYLFFFDNMIFAEHPDWSKCYCYSYHFAGAKEDWTKERNRLAVIELIMKNKMKGYLAYDGKKPVGWCNANDQMNYASLNIDEMSESAVCSIVCFVINPDYRRKGIAKSLLEKIIEDYTLKAYDMIEAYPAKNSHSCERNYHGHISMYEKYDFQVEKKFDEHYIVRKKL
jgi:ribosomal protein S18 acetylase RimI-like enzyme